MRVRGWEDTCETYSRGPISRTGVCHHIDGHHGLPVRFEHCPYTYVSNFVRLHGLLATFGEVENTGTLTREVERPPLNNDAVFCSLLWTGK